MSKSKGDLVYIPSSVTIYQVDENHDESVTTTALWAPGASAPIKKYKKTEKPMNVLCIGDADAEGYKKIIYESEPWLVREKDIYIAKRS